MSTELLGRAKELLAENARKRKMLGSGYHDDDVFHLSHAAVPMAPQHKLDPNDPTENMGHPRLGRKLPGIDENIVVFHGRREMKFVGDCAGKAYEALQQWLAKFGPKRPEQWSQLDGTQRKLCSEIPAIKITEVEGVPTLVLLRDTWNDFVKAFYQMGVGLSGLPEDPEARC